MARRNECELKPRDGQVLRVGIFARISGCQNQKEQSLDDQVAHAKEAVRELYSGPVKFKIIKVKAKGDHRAGLSHLLAPERPREPAICGRLGHQGGGVFS